MKLRSLSLFLEVAGGEEESMMDAEWVLPLLKVKGVKNVGLTMHVEVRILTHMPLDGMMKEIERQWTSV